jgi:hypothetical protein
MTTLKTPPKGRNAQIRTYWRLLQFALKHGIISGNAAAIYQELQKAKERIDTRPTDRLAEINIGQLVHAAQAELGMSLPDIGGVNCS